MDGNSRSTTIKTACGMLHPSATSSSFPRLHTLRFKQCSLVCGALLVHAAGLPALDDLQLKWVFPASEASQEALGELAKALRALGRQDLLDFQLQEYDRWREEVLGLEGWPEY